jgi:hypothetical protein
MPSKARLYHCHVPILWIEALSNPCRCISPCVTTAAFLLVSTVENLITATAIAPVRVLTKKTQHFSKFTIYLMTKKTAAEHFLSNFCTCTNCAFTAPYEGAPKCSSGNRDYEQICMLPKACVCPALSWLWPRLGYEPEENKPRQRSNFALMGA